MLASTRLLSVMMSFTQPEFAILARTMTCSSIQMTTTGYFFNYCPIILYYDLWLQKLSKLAKKKKKMRKKGGIYCLFLVDNVRPTGHSHCRVAGFCWAYLDNGLEDLPHLNQVVKVDFVRRTEGRDLERLSHALHHHLLEAL